MKIRPTAPIECTIPTFREDFDAGRIRIDEDQTITFQSGGREWEVSTIEFVREMLSAIEAADHLLSRIQTRLTSLVRCAADPNCIILEDALDIVRDESLILVSPKGEAK